MPLEFRVSLPTGRRDGMFRGNIHSQASVRCKENVREIKFNFRQFLMDYANNSSIHGIKYVFSERKNCFTRFFWAAAVCLAFGFSGFFLIVSYLKWQYEPDIGTNTEILNIRELPFPSVTICPQTKAKVEHLSFRNIYKNYWDRFELYGVSDEDAAYFESLLHVCDSELSLRLVLNETRPLEKGEIIRRLRELAYTVDEAMLFCKFRNVLVDCTSLFHEIVTSLGVCYSFNILNFYEMFKDVFDADFTPYHHLRNATWSVDNGYETDDLDSYPFPIISQPQDALKIILRTKDIDLDYICVGTTQGYKVFFHLPGDYPGLTGKHLFVPIKHDVVASMTAHVSKTSEKLKAYEPQQRKCFLSHEHPLKFFKNYSRNACYLECFANYTMNACGCVNFWMPRDNLTSVCSYAQLNCTLTAKRDMMLEFKRKTSSSIDCGCMSACTEITYEMESFSTEFDFKTLFSSYRYDLSDTPGVIMSRLTVYFQEPQFVSSERYALFTFRDYVAACGGVLGLFMGFSILSMFELIYYCMCLFSRLRSSR